MKIRSTAGITTVEVLPTHRRQGVLTEMMRFQLADLRERGEFLAVLLAAEWQIHGRFGYGPATFALDHDLVTEVAFKHFPTDHPLRWQLADVNAGQLSGEMDWLWVRLLDVSRALATRGYRTGGDLVLEVHDPFLGEHDRLPAERPRRRGGVRGDGPRAGPVARRARPRLDLPHASSAQASARADVLFGAAHAPHCPHWF
ncbi:sterol carrier protein [Lentzea atacamensis]|uniref:Sterol carrier protein n=1 Tax=Lentzea atacamensis TaxID=531938 RepID=A0A316HT95_9PSEU|nr:GNAT family N-acetyltransferase [Lentzea atacamensis]PWK83654.1 sterol carrier protein [Lentzea atacamensis]